MPSAKRRPAASPQARRQRGYALLLVIFLVGLVLVGTMSIGLRVLTEGRRQKEEEMIWRGKQYTRGIKLYYQKYGRFPTSLDNLTQPGPGNIRFMRQAYKDPMNKDDGSWRLIYVGPAGQLIGSLKPQPMNALMPGARGIGQPAASTGIGGFGATASPSVGFTAGTTAGATAPGTATTGAGSGAQSTAAAAGGDQPVPMGDTPTLVGGNIIGVGSKVNQPSIMVYEKAKNYRLFEFIWDPSKDLGIAGGAPGTPLGTPVPGQNPLNAQPGPGAGQPPNPLPLQNPPNPNPNP